MSTKNIHRYLLLFIMLCWWQFAAFAYNDHRVTGTDSIEQALKHPERLHPFLLLAHHEVSPLVTFHR